MKDPLFMSWKEGGLSSPSSQRGMKKKWVSVTPGGDGGGGRGRKDGGGICAVQKIIS